MLNPYIQICCHPKAIAEWTAQDAIEQEEWREEKDRIKLKLHLEEERLKAEATIARNQPLDYTPGTNLPRVKTLMVSLIKQIIPVSTML